MNLLVVVIPSPDDTIIAGYYLYMTRKKYIDRRSAMLFNFLQLHRAFLVLFIGYCIISNGKCRRWPLLTNSWVQVARLPWLGARYNLHGTFPSFCGVQWPLCRYQLEGWLGKFLRSLERLKCVQSPSRLEWILFYLLKMQGHTVSMVAATSIYYRNSMLFSTLFACIDGWCVWHGHVWMWVASFLQYCIVNHLQDDLGDSASPSATCHICTQNLVLHVIRLWL